MKQEEAVILKHKIMINVKTCRLRVLIVIKDIDKIAKSCIIVI